MVEDRVTDGRRIAELLASELDGRADGPLDRIAVVNADEDVTPAGDGARAYDVAVDGSVLASVFVHPERARLAFALDDAASSGDRDVSIESGAEVKSAVDEVIAAAGGRPG